MPENEKTPEQQLSEAKETIRRGMTMISNVVHARQDEVGYWPDDDGSLVDYRTFFAELHSKVSTAYETYKEGVDPTHLIWIDPASGREVPAGFGSPQGLSMDLLDIVFNVLGFATNVGINVGGLAAEVVLARPPSEVSGEEGSGPDAGGEEEEEDFDLEAMMAGEVQGEPPSVEIPDDPTAVEGSASEAEGTGEG